MAKEQLLAMKQVNTDEKYYPRMKWGWQTAYQYAMAMKAGAEFPAIEVAKIDGKYHLLDGRHRLEALKMNGEKHVQAMINTSVKTFDKLFLEAINRNVVHGRPFSVQEKTNIALRLQKMKFKNLEISRIIQVPIEKFEKFVATRITTDVKGKPIPLKKTVRHKASMPVEESFEDVQDEIHAGTSQIVLLDDFITLLENNLLDTKNKDVMKRVEKIISLVFALEREIRK